MADHPRQQRARAHVGASQADAREQKCGPRVGRAETEIRRERDSFTRILDTNRAVEKELHLLQQSHSKERQLLASLREKAAALRSQLETVPLPSFMISCT